MERAGCFWGSVPARVAPAPELAHHVGDGNKLAAWERMCTRDFDGGTDVGDTQHAADYSRI
jgi:hypothetical protein